MVATKTAEVAMPSNGANKASDTELSFSLSTKRTNHTGFWASTLEEPPTKNPALKQLQDVLETQAWTFERGLQEEAHWTCCVCTLINPAAKLMCEVCETQQPLMQEVAALTNSGAANNFGYLPDVAGDVYVTSVAHQRPFLEEDVRKVSQERVSFKSSQFSVRVHALELQEDMPEKRFWVCGACTYNNFVCNATCAVCDLPKPTIPGLLTINEVTKLSAFRALQGDLAKSFRAQLGNTRASSSVSDHQIDVQNSARSSSSTDPWVHSPKLQTAAQHDPNPFDMATGTSGVDEFWEFCMTASDFMYSSCKSLFNDDATTSAGPAYDNLNSLHDANVSTKNTVCKLPKEERTLRVNPESGKELTDDIGTWVFQSCLCREGGCGGRKLGVDNLTKQHKVNEANNAKTRKPVLHCLARTGGIYSCVSYQAWFDLQGVYLICMLLGELSGSEPSPIELFSIDEVSFHHGWHEI